MSTSDHLPYRTMLPNQCLSSLPTTEFQHPLPHWPLIVSCRDLPSLVLDSRVTVFVVLGLTGLGYECWYGLVWASRRPNLLVDWRWLPPHLRCAKFLTGGPGHSANRNIGFPFVESSFGILLVEVLPMICRIMSGSPFSLTMVAFRTPFILSALHCLLNDGCVTLVTIRLVSFS